MSGLSFSLTKLTAIRTVRLSKSGQIRDCVYSDSVSNDEERTHSQTSLVRPMSYTACGIQVLLAQNRT